jgi:outer membrane lipoprotein-sorting protein
MRARNRISALAAFFAVITMAAAAPAHAEEKLTALDVLKKYDATMSPRTFDALITMVAHRQDDTTRTYKFRALKLGDDKMRLWFYEPASAKGQEMLRVGDNMWVYMPNLKRALRLASRESFQGGDFNNGDALRVNYVADYTPTFADSGDPALYLLDLQAKVQDAAYDRIKLWIRKSDLQPAKAEYYAQSGKLLRSMDFSDVKDFHGLSRPSHLVMKNELASKRWSEMNTLDMKLNVEVPPQKFVLDDLGR